MKTTKIHVALLVLFGLVGCSNEPVLFEVQGEVRTPLQVLLIGTTEVVLDQVIPLAEIEFIPDSEDNPYCLPARGMTDLEGKFELETPNHGTGATAGTYKIVVRANKAYFKDPLPKEFSDPTATTLVAEVPEGGDLEVKIHLNRKVPRIDFRPSSPQ